MLDAGSWIENGVMEALHNQMDDKEKWRTRVHNAVRRYFERRSAPRIILGLLLIMTGLFGLLISFVSLHLGLEQMWVRYPLAVLGSYAFFFALLRLWVQLERSRFNPQAEEIQAAIAAENQPDIEAKLAKYGRGSWLDWLDLPFSLGDIGDFFDLDEGCFPALVIGILVAVVGSLIVLLLAAMTAAPAFLAEVFVDVFIVSVLYRRLRIAAQENWLGTAIRKTWWLALLTAALLSLAGWGLETLAPGSRSIGPAIEKILHG
jgi:hypothetical protein